MGAYPGGRQRSDSMPLACPLCTFYKSDVHCLVRLVNCFCAAVSVRARCSSVCPPYVASYVPTVDALPPSLPPACATG